MPYCSPNVCWPTEPPIASPNCPRQYGIFADEANCNTFWSCWAGEANKYECPPGLAYDSEQRVCVWADQVAACKKAGTCRRSGGRDVLNVMCRVIFWASFERYLVAMSSAKLFRIASVERRRGYSLMNNIKILISYQ